MYPPIVFDVLRLSLGASSLVPRGIDRVDVAYARFLFESWPGDCLGVLPTPWGLRLYDRARVLRALDRIEYLWRENAAGPDVQLTRLLGRMDGSTAEPGGHRLPGRALRNSARFARMLNAAGLSLGSSVIAHAPKTAIYLNVGQLGWAASWMVRWLSHRPDIRAVFLLHDAIPIERPDLVTPMGVAMHRRMASVASRHAAGLIFTTQDAARSVLRVLPPRERSLPRTISLHLPVAPSFLAPAGREPAPHDSGLAGHPYFVIAGAIEPRKNHLLLLHVWHDLARRRGAAAPYLIVVGSPARGGRAILDQLRARGPARDRIIPIAGLSSPGLRQLMARSRALLMPSLAEGFGLPIVEALAVGTPVLASSLAAHREVGGDFAIYLDPADPAGWLREIDRLVDDGEVATALRRRIAGYQPMTSGVYFARVAEFLREMA